jgi:hypothetical protein
MVDQHLVVFALAVGLAYLYAFVGGFTDAGVRTWKWPYP